MVAEEVRDAVLVALQGADAPLRAKDLADAAQVKSRQLTEVLPALIADGVVLSGRDGYAMSSGQMIAAAASVDEVDFPEPEPGFKDDDEIVSGEPPPLAPTPSGEPDAGVTVADVLARLDGPIRVRADVILEAQADGTMRVAELLRVTGLG